MRKCFFPASLSSLASLFHQKNAENPKKVTEVTQVILKQKRFLTPLGEFAEKQTKQKPQKIKGKKHPKSYDTGFYNK